MKVLHLNTYDEKGGAARAARRMHNGCREIGIDSKMLVQYKTSEDSSIEGLYTSRIGWLASKGWEIADSLPLIRYSRRPWWHFSTAWQSACEVEEIQNLEYDVLHLHWITNGYLTPKQIAAFDGPLIWTFHDMWPFTGGCHYSGECVRYERQCGRCPQLSSKSDEDLTRGVWERKRSMLEATSIDVVVPSTWMAERVRESSLFGDSDPHVIPNPLDTEFFSPNPKLKSKQVFDLPREKQIVLIGGISGGEGDRKGFELFQDSLRHLDNLEEVSSFDVAVFGSTSPRDLSIQGDVDVHELGYVDDKLLPTLYSAAGVLVVPSRQEAFGQMASEALSCGTPVVAFRSTGLEDIVDHQQTGYLAEPFFPEDLADGIAWTLAKPDRRRALSNQSREVAMERFDQQTVAEAYAKRYRTIVD